MKWLFRFVGNVAIGGLVVGFFSFSAMDKNPGASDFATAIMLAFVFGFPVGWAICWLIDNPDKYTFKI